VVSDHDDSKRVAGFGCSLTIVQGPPHLAVREEPRARSWRKSSRTTAVSGRSSSAPGAAAPLAGDLIHTRRARDPGRVPVSVLNDTIAQFPTFSEAFGYALGSPSDQELLLPADFCAYPYQTEQPARVRAAKERGRACGDLTESRP
jgi:hypothetical protein